MNRSMEFSIFESMDSDLLVHEDYFWCHICTFKGHWALKIAHVPNFASCLFAIQKWLIILNVYNYDSWIQFTSIGSTQHDLLLL